MDSIFNAIRSIGFRRGPDSVIGGVCGGIARSLGVDANLVRLVTVALMVFAGLPLAVYIAVWILTPAQDGSIPLQRFLGDLGIGTKGPGRKNPEYPTSPAAPQPTRQTDGVQQVPYAQDR